MKRIAFVTFFVLALMHALVDAQQGGVNTAVLPANNNRQLDPGDVPDEYLKTDLIAQKQLEGSIAASTRKPDRLLAAFNDYRGVNAADFVVGENFTPPNTVFSLIARLFRRPAARPRPSVRAAAEAWVGAATSDDAGATWSGIFLPGSLNDNSPASMNSPLRKFGFEASTDPWVAAGPCGYFYIATVNFTRTKDSAVSVMTFQDQNNADGVHTIKYLRTSIVAYVRNASQGPFVDLPYAVVDPRRPATSTDPCAQNVYVTWMTFSGKDESTKPSFARSMDYGQTWQKATITAQGKTNQRAVLAVDPREGTPTTTGGGTLYLAFRSFLNDASLPGMWITRSIDFGVNFDKPVMMNGTALQAFDQLAVPSSGSNPDFLAFRSAAYVTIAVVPPAAQQVAAAAPGGGGGGGGGGQPPSTIYAAWSERVCVFTTGCSGGIAFGRPQALGEGRIVMMKASSADWKTWKDVSAPETVGARKGINMVDRDVTPPAAGLGMLPSYNGGRPSGTQFQPHLVSGGNQLGLVYFESRGPLTEGATGPYAGGLHRHVDARFDVLDPATGAVLGTSQISRYPISANANLGDGEQIDDIANVAEGVNVKAVSDKVNAPSSGGGLSAFIGDYIGATATLTHVVDQTTKQWRWGYKAGDLPYPGARVVFSDSRNVVPPLDSSGSPLADHAQLAAYAVTETNPGFSPWINPDGSPNTGCVNPGSRNHDLMHTLVDSSVILAVPTTFKLLGTIQRTFPASVINGRGESRWFRLDLTPTETATKASFVQGDSPTTLTTIATQLWVNLLPYSSTTRPVYVASTLPTGSVRVDLYEVTNGTDTSTAQKLGSAVLNMDPTNATSVTSATNETHNVVVSPLVTAPLVTAPLVTANGYTSSTANPLVTAPLVTAASVEETALSTQDFSWTVTGGTEIVNSAVAARVSLKKADLNKLATTYRFELRISRRAKHGAVAGCNITNNGLSDEQLISSIPINPAIAGDTDPTQSPLVTADLAEAPLVTAPLVTAPLVTAPLVTAATFNMAPPDNHTGSYHDGTTHDVLDNRVHITLRAYAIVDKNNLPVLPPPQIQVVALSKNIVPDGLGGWKFETNPGVLVLNDGSPLAEPRPVLAVADNAGWVVVSTATQR